MREADKFKKLEERELPKAEEAWKLLEDFPSDSSFQGEYEQ